MECGGKREGLGDLTLGGCLSQGAAVMVSVFHQHVCKCVVESVWAWALIFTYGTNISKAINGVFQLSTFSKNVISHPKVFLQCDSASLPQNWICKQQMMG